MTAPLPPAPFRPAPARPALARPTLARTALDRPAPTLRRAPAPLSALALLAALLPAACAAQHPSSPAAMPRAAEGGVCRLGPGGAPPDAALQAQSDSQRPVDQGIGGTGSPLRHLADAVPVDQGIGGTGLSPDGDAARPGAAGGRLGVVGVVTGFASVCVDGREIAYDAATSVRLDGAPATAQDLRAGQVVVLDASRGPGSRAASIAVRHEVTGPVERLAPGPAPGLAMVAGQPVRLSDASWGAAALRPGAWVSVSGLRDASGVIQATRIDPHAPGPVSVRGRLVPGAVPGAAPRIGRLAVHAASPVPPGAADGEVEATGRYADGSLLAASVTPDLLARDPVAYFGAAVDSYLVESFATRTAGGLLTGSGLRAAYHGPDSLAGDGRRVIALSRAPGGRGLVATAITDVVPQAVSHVPPAGASGAGAEPGAGAGAGHAGSGAPGPAAAGAIGPQDSAGAIPAAGDARVAGPGSGTQALAPAPMPSPPAAQGAGTSAGGLGPRGVQGQSPSAAPPAAVPGLAGGQGLLGGPGFGGGGGRPGGR